MHANPIFALIQVAVFPGATVVALAFTAAILIPAGFWLWFLWEKMAAKISKKNS